MSGQGNSKILSLAVTGLIITNVVLLCFMFFKKQGPHGGQPFPREPFNQGPPDGERPPDRMVRELNFTEDQKTAFLKLKNEHKKSVGELLDKNKNFREDFFDQLSSQDSSRVNSLADSISSTQK
ncbi:MAG: hypothetical protein IAF38_18125, partial [Bacteroidia bacterium]|nr:hypothetical protein [Bacteroidia bacterium]